jgi:hypothetical protein
MYANAGDAKFACVAIPNITTSMAADVSGLMIE